MTAFSSSESSSQAFTVRWEMRSVNHRYLDIKLRLPDFVRTLEPKIRSEIGKRLKRGTVDCVLTCHAHVDSEDSLAIDLNYVKRLLSAADSVESVMNAPLGYSALEILKWPGVQIEPEINVAELGLEVISVLEATLRAQIDARQREGNSLSILLDERCQLMRRQVEIIRSRMPELRDKFRAKLKAKLEDIQAMVDSERFEQELVFMLQKMDIDEEIERLDTHISEMLRLLQQSEPIGRRMDFLLQEMNREANTIGSKSVDSITTQSAIEMKVLIEQMREQVQNIE